MGDKKYLTNCDPADEDDQPYHGLHEMTDKDIEDHVPRPDYDPHIDYPERYMNPDVRSI